MRRFANAILILLITAILGGGWYVYHKGFTRKWRIFVSEEFRKRGVELTLRKLTLDPLRGIIAEEVKLFDGPDRKRTLAVIDDMRLVINWANLIRGKTFLDALDLRDARLSLPLDPKETRGPKVEITRLSGRLMLPPKQVYLSNLEAELYGIRVTASGRLVNPQNLTESLRHQDPSAKNTSADTIARIIDELLALKFEGEPPVLDVRFSGDLAHHDTLFVEAKLSADKVRRGNWRLESIYLDALYRDERLAIRQLSISDSKGELRLSGSYDPQAKGLEFQVHSTIDPQLAVRTFMRVPQLEEFVFYQPPSLDFIVRAAFGDSPEMQASGHVSAERFGLRSVIFESFEADLVLDGERWAARNLRLVHRSGEMTGDVMQLPGDFRSRLNSTLDPKTLSPLLGTAIGEWLKQFEFTDSPDIHVEARGLQPAADKLWANGVLRLGRTSYRGVPAQSATATMRYLDRRLTVDPLRVVRAEGTGEGGLVFDFARNEVEIHKVQTTLNPQEVIPWIDEKLTPDIAPYRFGKRPPQLSIDGVVHTKGGDSTQLRIEVDAPSGMDYTFMRRDLHFPKIAGKLLFLGPRMKIDSLNAILFGGKLRGLLDISLQKDAPGHQAELWLENVDFAALTKLYFKYDTSKGRLNGHYAFAGQGDDPKSMRGQGQLAVTEGQVFAIPFLGPLSGILNTIVPGMGEDEARKGSASFTVDSGVISTSDFLVEGTGFSMIGGGKLFYLDDKMDFDVRINARGLPGVLLFPVSKLFEYTSTDALSKPNWRPKIVPRF